MCPGIIWKHVPFRIHMQMVVSGFSRCPLRKDAGPFCRMTNLQALTIGWELPRRPANPCWHWTKRSHHAEKYCRHCTHRKAAKKTELLPLPYHITRPWTSRPYRQATIVDVGGTKRNNIPRGSVWVCGSCKGSNRRLYPTPDLIIQIIEFTFTRDKFLDEVMQTNKRQIPPRQ